MNGKVCSKPSCAKFKPYSEFHKNAQTDDGYHGQCKECRREALYRWRSENKGRIKEYNIKHKVQITEASIAYYWRNREAVLAKRKLRKLQEQGGKDANSIMVGDSLNSNMEQR